MIKKRQFRVFGLDASHKLIKVYKGITYRNGVV